MAWEEGYLCPSPREGSYSLSPPSLGPNNHPPFVTRNVVFPRFRAIQSHAPASRELAEPACKCVVDGRRFVRERFHLLDDPLHIRPELRGHQHRISPPPPSGPLSRLLPRSIVLSLDPGRAPAPSSGHRPAPLCHPDQARSQRRAQDAVPCPPLVHAPFGSP